MVGARRLKKPVTEEPAHKDQQSSPANETAKAAQQTVVSQVPGQPDLKVPETQKIQAPEPIKKEDKVATLEAPAPSQAKKIVPSPPAKKQPEKQKKAEKKEIKKSSKIEEKAPPAKEKALKEPVKESTKKKTEAPPLKKVPVKEAPGQSQKISSTQKVSASPPALAPSSDHVSNMELYEGDGEEVCIADIAYTEDALQQEFGRNFSIPQGFEDYESFTISFDIKDGKVVNVSPHTTGALVVYAAVKDALLKSTMPGRNRKHIVWVIT